MVASDYKSTIELDFFGDVNDLFEIVDALNADEKNRFTVEHVVLDSGADVFFITDNTDADFLGNLYETRVDLVSMSNACIKFVFYKRPDLFPVFMHDGEWQNGDNMTSDIAAAIVNYAFFE